MIEARTIEQKLRGALAHIERRSQPSADFNEFGQAERLVDFKATRTVLPPPIYGAEGIRIFLEIRLGSSYTTFKGDDDEVLEKAEQNAYRAMCRVLYEDVLDDLIPVMRAVGDGKRGEALRLLNNLYVRLNGRE